MLFLAQQLKKILKTLTVLIDGMHCNHCVFKVETALKNIKGVEAVKVDLVDKKATLSLSENVAKEIIVKAICDLDFTVCSIQD